MATEQLGRGSFLKVEFWNKAQKPAAIVSGVLLVIIIIAIASRDVLPQLGSYLQNIGRQADEQNQPTATQPSDKQDTPDTASPTEQPQASTPPATSDAYSYTAQPGDSYTAFARAAVGDYAKAHSISLSPADALNAEIALANAAGLPELEIGQKVTIATQDIARVVPSTDSQAKASGAPDETKDTSSSSSNGDYTYTAVAGDAYSWLARKAVSSYMSSAKVDLSPAQRLAAEADLTTRAGSPLLEVGQKVTLPASEVKVAIDAARQLSAAQQAAWQVYVPFAEL